MRYYKTIYDSYIISIGIGCNGEEITKQEYTEILAVIKNKPTARKGYDYKLKTDFNWEEYEMPPIESETEEEATDADYENALRMVGVDV